MAIKKSNRRIAVRKKAGVEEYVDNVNDWQNACDYFFSFSRNCGYPLSADEKDTIYAFCGFLEGEYGVWAR